MEKPDCLKCDRTSFLVLFCRIILCIECSQCRTDRSMLCKMAMLQQHCMIPAFQRICCKSCSVANTTSIAPPMGHPLTTPRVSTRNPGFTMTTTRPVSTTLTLTGDTTESISYTEYNTWEYTILTTGTKVEAKTPNVPINTPSNFLTEPNTPTSFATTTQTSSPKVTLSIIDDAIQNKAVNTDTEKSSVTRLIEVDVTLVTSPTAEFDESEVGSGAHRGTKVQTSGVDELSTSGWNETETVTDTSMTLILTTLLPTFEEKSTPEESIEPSSIMTTPFSTKPVTVIMTTPVPTVEKLTTTRPSIKEEENNAIEVPFQINGVDSEFPENNIIPRRGRVFLRERTRNKRIQELLEEKRNFLRRMKRAQGY